MVSLVGGIGSRIRWSGHRRWTRGWRGWSCPSLLSGGGVSPAPQWAACNCGGEVSGPALAVKSVLGAFSPDGSVQRDMADPMMRERMGCDELLIPSEDGGVEDDVTGRSLVDVGFERFGSLAADEVFALVPAYCLSGRMEASMLAVEPAVAHVAFLGQSTQPTMRPDMLAAFGGEIADLLAAQGVVDPATGKPITFNQ